MDFSVFSDSKKPKNPLNNVKTLFSQLKFIFLLIFVASSGFWKVFSLLGAVSLAGGWLAGGLPTQENSSENQKKPNNQ